MKRFLFGVLFSLFLMVHAVPAQANLVSGGVATGSIVAGGTSDQYFTGNTGQNVILSIFAGYHASISIYEPVSGTLWASGLDRVNGALPASGTFHVVIKGYLPTDIGGKNINQCIKGQVSEACGGNAVEW